ncbi:hypothetical protein ABFV62_27945, partial [Pseudomonas syringae]|uniref:hypothetical protein n=1 Tax=Pseudomonas syringae TaxID=317 RepID=UPI0034D75023
GFQRPQLNSFYWFYRINQPKHKTPVGAALCCEEASTDKHYVNACTGPFAAQGCSYRGMYEAR